MADRLLKLVIALVFFAFDSVRAALLRLTGRRTSPFVILMYHSVKRHERGRFSRQMDRVRGIATPVYADFDTATRRDGPFIAVTFDDAYSSVVENALPVLREKGVPATIFVPTGYIGSTPGWITNAGHRDADERVLTADELRRLRKAGVLVGSHGVWHRPLTELQGQEVVSELEVSRQTLERVLGETVSLFALPYGSSNAEVMNSADRAGYSRVFLSVPVSGADACLAVGRIDVSPADWGLEYSLKIRDAYRWLPLAVAAKARMRKILRFAVRKNGRRLD